MWKMKKSNVLETLKLSWKIISPSSASPCVVSECKWVKSYAHACLLSRCLQWATLRHSASLLLVGAVPHVMLPANVTSAHPCYPVFLFDFVIRFSDFLDPAQD